MDQISKSQKKRLFPPRVELGTFARVRWTERIRVGLERVKIDSLGELEDRQDSTLTRQLGSNKNYSGFTQVGPRGRFWRRNRIWFKFENAKDILSTTCTRQELSSGQVLEARAILRRVSMERA